MKDQSFKSSRELRKQHNSELIRRMRNGEPLTSFDSKASWYPPRPIIKKDKVEMARLYDVKARDIAIRPLKKDFENVLELSELQPIKPLNDAG